MPDGPDWQPPLDRAIADVVAALDEGREPELCARRALQTTEVIFATYESSRRQGRLDLPLILEDCPLLVSPVPDDARPRAAPTADAGGNGS